MEPRQPELYSNVLSGTVVDWGSMGPGEEWVNSAALEGEQGLSRGAFRPAGEEAVNRSSDSEDFAQTVQNGENWTEEAAEHRGEWGKMPPAGEEQWGKTPASRSDWVMSSAWDMPPDRRGYLDSQPLREADEDSVTEVNLGNPVMTEEDRQEIQHELAKLEEEICTLRQVLLHKERQHTELKQKLGITPLSEFRNNFSRGWQDMQSSLAYKKTSETLSSAGQKTSAAISTLGSTITRKFGDMSYSIRQSMSMPTMRNSPSFKSFEEKVESTVSNIKTKAGSSAPAGSFEDVLSSTANASSQDTPTNNLTDRTEMPC